MKLDFKVTIEFESSGNDEQLSYCPFVAESLRCFIDSYVENVNAALLNGTIYFKNKSVSIGSIQTLEEMFRGSGLNTLPFPRL